MSEQRRPLFWEGSSKKDFKAFPVAVQKDMGVALFIAQLGRTAGSAKPWKGLGDQASMSWWRTIEATRFGRSTWCT